MATIAARQRSAAAPLILLLGTAIFLNYVDRGALPIASPLLKGELGLSNEAYGWAVAAFFWIYAPIQFFAGWLCDRFSVYKLLAGGIVIWSASTMLTGFVAGFASLFVLRGMLVDGEIRAFGGSSNSIALHVPAEQLEGANSALAK